MSSTATRFTRDDYELLPERLRCELVEGWLVKQPSPRYGHQHVVARLFLRLTGVVGDGRVVFAPMDIELGEHTVVRPDLSVFAEPLPHRAQKPLPIPQMVVEVLSPETAARDRLQKTRLYLAAGVREVWLVDPDTGAIEVRTSAGVTFHGPDDEAVSVAIAGFRVTGAALVR